MTAEAIFDALRNRRCFGTTGSRIFLDARANGASMGEETRARNGKVALSLEAVGTRPILSAALIRDGEELHSFAGDGTKELRVHHVDRTADPGRHWYYWRVTQAGDAPALPGNVEVAHGTHAYSSPTWVAVE